MRRQNESKLVWCLALGGMFLIFCLVSFNDNLAQVGDSVFLYNRLVQIKDCLAHGKWPFFYYEDLGGIGYGSPIFYGHLTLFPFLPLAGNISAFVKAYYLSCLLLNFFGFRCFLKRFSSYATLTSCFYVFSMTFCGLYNANIPANVMAVGWSWFFFAYCIDYFRDYRGFIPFILTYFMIWQSNFNTTVIATLFCMGIGLAYFKRDRIKGYLVTVLVVFLTVGYNIANILDHLDALRLVDPEYMLGILTADSDARVTSIHPLGGYVLRSYFKGVDGCVGFMTFSLFAVFVFFVIRGFRTQSRRFKVMTVVGLMLAFAGYALGTWPIWSEFYKATNVFFQFPIRYWVFLFGFVLAILSRVIKPNKLVYLAVLFCLLDVVIVNPFRSAPSTGLYYVAYQLGNGEYASNEFVMDWATYSKYYDAVVSESGEDYAFERGFNLVKVDCSANTGGDVLTLPKLYYRGYQARGEGGVKFAVKPGYSNYCQVDIGDYTGVLRLYYEVPNSVMRFFFIQVFVLGYLVWALLRYEVVPKFKEKLSLRSKINQ